ncbi:sulfatase-like hydrolase/transferase [Acidobacteriota bacterium]
MNLILKSKTKSGLIITVCLSWILMYGYFFELGKGSTFGDMLIWRHKYIFSIWCLVFILALILISRRRSHFNQATKVLNLISATLIVFCLVNIVGYVLKNKSPVSSIPEEKIAQKTRAADAERRDTAASPLKPDIYYIILDAYAGPDVLDKHFGFDNTEFYEYLNQKGFYTPLNSRSNYSTTRFSLASSLNMDYIQNLSTKSGLAPQNFPMIYAPMTKDNEVARILKQNGYMYVSIGFKNEYADLELVFGTGEEFSKYLFINSLLNMTFFRYVLRVADIGVNPRFREGILYTFDEISKIHKIKGPKFTFAHVLSPHRPYVFGPNGEKNTIFKAISLQPRQLYIRQLMYINTKVKSLIDNILEQSEVPPIIILQADHGPILGTPSDSLLDPRSLQNRYGILNSYYLPGASKDIIYDSITPVNSFRIILNHYLNTQYQLLKDESYLYFKKEFVKVDDKMDR